MMGPNFRRADEMHQTTDAAAVQKQRERLMGFAEATPTERKQQRPAPAGI